MIMESLRLAPFKVRLGKDIVDIDAEINKLPLYSEARIYWECATDVRRQGVLVRFIIENCGKSEKYMDGVFSVDGD